uniref:DUF4371 domain-containing protein n=1 Tax=Romanomermis culicivorax TaxID=13658 RepID=A0A915J693_ROMCU
MLKTEFSCQPIYEATIVKIKSIIGDSDVCFILDETTDIKQHAILNILVTPVAGKPVKPMLLKLHSSMINIV